MTFKVLGVSHVGFAPKDINKASDFLSAILGLKQIGHDEVVVEQKTTTRMFESRSSAIPTNPSLTTEKMPEELTRIELLQATPTSEGPIASFLEKKGAGIHHLAFKVDNIEAALQFLKSNNIELIDQVPRIGAGNCKIVFVHPRATGGILIELTEEADS
ncbi:MAG: VOC family protein [Oligoflexales bacterium]|nr:VOC family protein [Oligoflexales bacterium]